VSEWAASYYRVAKGPLRGAWDNAVAPYAVEIMDSFCDPTVWKIVVVGPTQATKTEAVIVIPLLYFLFHCGLDVLLMLPTQELAQSVWRERIEPAICDNTELRQMLLPVNLAGRSGEHYFANGTTLSMIGADSIARLASRTFPVVLADEVDKYKPQLGEEADPLSLLIRRTDAFAATRKVGICCTVTTEDGRIWKEYQAGDQRHYHVPCPDCTEAHVLNYDNLRYDATVGADAVRLATKYKCPRCRRPWDDQQRRKAVAGGHWQASQAGVSGIRSFHYNALYSPFRTLGDLAAEIVDSKDDEVRKRDVQQASMVLPWTADVPDKLTSAKVLSRRGDYAVRTVPTEVQLITGGVDVHKTVLYYVFRGWAPSRPHPYSWLIDYGVVDRVGADKPLSLALRQIAEAVETGWLKSDGEILTPSLTLIDSGYETDGIYAFVRQQGQRRFLAYKGQVGARIAEYRLSKLPESGVSLVLGNADVWKTKVHILANVGDCDTPGYFALPAETEFWYSRHLTAEEWRETTMEKGKLVAAHWHPIRKQNHLLDCEAMAALAARLRGVFGDPRPAAPPPGASTSGFGDLVSSVLQEYA
jgi:phage terminase large subunit GpA-like protein